MQTVTRQQIIDCLNTLGIQPGDTLMIHSAIQFLGKPAGDIPAPDLYLDALREAVGSPEGSFPLGALAVPCFNFAFARGERYDPQTTPSQGMGIFSETVRQHPDARRTAHPMQSLAVIGRYADELARCDTPSAFEDGSAFARLLELDFKLLLLGADIQYVAMVHYSEQRFNVPYRYWKTFQGEVLTPQGWQQRSYKMFVRDMEIDPYLGLKPIQHVLEAHGQWQSVRLNYGQVAVCKLSEFVAAANTLLAADPWALVTNVDAQQRAATQFRRAQENPEKE